jgi:hypothetical protein
MAKVVVAFARLLDPVSTFPTSNKRQKWEMQSKLYKLHTAPCVPNFTRFRQTFQHKFVSFFFPILRPEILITSGNL